MDIIRGLRIEMERAASGWIAERLSRSIEERGKAVLGIPGGRSVIGILRLLREISLPWESVDIFLVDERMVPMDDPERNSALVGPHLKGKFHQSVEDYTTEFDRAGGTFDLILLSSGEDGHVASLFPNHPSIGNEEDGYIKVHDAPKPPPLRISASRALLSRSRSCVLLFFGDAKKDALQTFLDDDVTVTGCPAKLVGQIRASKVFTDIELE